MAGSPGTGPEGGADGSPRRSTYGTSIDPPRSDRPECLVWVCVQAEVRPNPLGAFIGHPGVAYSAWFDKVDARVAKRSAGAGSPVGAEQERTGGCAGCYDEGYGVGNDECGLR
jgi:hypothetical protein